jgi:hypothetical protein
MRSGKVQPAGSATHGQVQQGETWQERSRGGWHDTDLRNITRRRPGRPVS